MTEQDHVDQSKARHLVNELRDMTTKALEWAVHELEVELRERDEEKTARPDR